MKMQLYTYREHMGGSGYMQPYVDENTTFYREDDVVKLLSDLVIASHETEKWEELRQALIAENGLSAALIVRAELLAAELSKET